MRDSSATRWVAVGLLFLAALGLRLINIDYASLWGDEIHQTLCASRGFLTVWDCHAWDKPPLDYYFQAFFMKFGHSEFWARFHSAIFGALFVVASAWWGWIVGRWRMALLMAGISFSLPLTLRFSQEARPYMLMMLSEALFLAMLTRIFLTGKKARPAHWYLLACFFGLGVWTFFLLWEAFAAAVLLAFFVALTQKHQIAKAFQPFRRSAFAVSWSALFLAFFASGAALLWRSLVTRRGDFFRGYDVGNFWTRAGDYLDIFVSGYARYQFIPNMRWIVLLLLAIGLIAIVVRSARTVAGFYAIMLFVILFLGSFLRNIVMDHWMEMRYTLTALPPLILFSAIGLESLLAAGEKILRRNNPGSLLPYAVAAGLVALLHTQLVLREPLVRTDWRAATKYLAEHSSQNTSIFVRYPTHETALGYYMNRFGVPGTVRFGAPEDLATTQTMQMDKPALMVLEHFERNWKMQVLLDPMTWRISAVPRLEILHLGNPLMSEQKLEEVTALPPWEETGELQIDVGEYGHPLLGRGYYPPETWGETKVRPIAHGYGEFFVPLRAPQALEVLIPSIVYSEVLERQNITATLMVNDELISDYRIENPDEVLRYSVSMETLEEGVNRFSIHVNKTVSPADVEEGNTDPRHLSLWLKGITVRAAD